mgnify:CR=1 FL=1
MKKKLLMTTALVAALSIGNVMPVFAYTADGVWSNEQHTTFGIQEGSATDFAHQASFEVPLYVTMAAIDNTDKGNFDPEQLVTPEGYDIKNSSTKADSYIAVESFDVEMYNTATWSIITFGSTPNTSKEMTFKIGNQELRAQTAGQTIKYGTKDVKQENKNVDLQDGIFAKTDGKLNPLGAQQYMSNHSTAPGKGIPLFGKIQATNRANNGTGTAAQFRVIYHMVPTDKDGNKKTAAAYVGDNKTEAGYK